MNDLAKRAKANANRARTAQEPRGGRGSYTPTSDDTKSAQRRSWWAIRTADGREFLLMVLPELSKAEILDRLYPGASAVIPAHE